MFQTNRKYLTTITFIDIKKVEESKDTDVSDEEDRYSHDSLTL